MLAVRHGPLQYSLTESWISESPPLLLCYLRQYVLVLLEPMSQVAHTVFVSKMQEP